ncbi:reverse transcriptase domain-containing protein [Sphaerimonospora sp. CA-214678]|uniref:reverse transcriptase domain-containing protein n=1 Tax=Sphaerimonospora sp. CA-214678 TaxID=3240029 RepID=UPI003D94BC54
MNTSVTPQAHSLMPFLDERHLVAALRQCGRRRSSPGADGMTWADYRRAAAVRIPRLARGLRDGTWRPGPLRANPFATYTGRELPCVIPTVEDRLVHRALRNAVEPILEARAFADWVSGYRPGRNRLTTLRQAMALVDSGLTWVADVDVEQVSQGSDPEEVTNWLAVHVHDGTFLDRFRTALSGLPSPLAPGTGVSPLLINLRLSRADRLLPNLPLVRFADNYCAFAADQVEAEAAMERILDALEAVGMAANPAKSRVRDDVCVEDLFLIAG